MQSFEDIYIICGQPMQKIQLMSTNVLQHGRRMVLNQKGSNMQKSMNECAKVQTQLYMYAFFRHKKIDSFAYKHSCHNDYQESIDKRKTLLLFISKWLKPSINMFMLQ